MIKKILSLIHTDTGRDSAIVFTGTVANIVAGGIFFILAPRLLGPADYGIFATIVATGMMAGAIANFGIDTGILRFAPKRPQEFNAVLTLALKYYIAFGLAAAGVGFFIAPALAEFLGQSHISQFLRIAFIGTIFILLTNFFVASLQAKGEFFKASIINISSNFSRLLLLLVGIYFLKADLLFLTLIFFFIPIVSMIVGKLYLPLKIEKSENIKSLEFFKYNFWIAGALIISSIPLDNFFLLKLAGTTQAGFYAAPLKLLTFVYQIGGSFTRVLASRFASFDTNKKTFEFAKKALILPVIFSVGLILLILIAQPLTEILFGREYHESVMILRILSLGFIFFFISTIPSSIILYYLGKSEISFVITLIKYSAFLLLLLLLVPGQKAVGAAIAFSIAEFLSLAMMAVYATVKIKKNVPN